MWLVVLRLLYVVYQCCMVNYSQPLTMWQITVNYEYGLMVSGKQIFVCFFGCSNMYQSASLASGK